MPVVRSVYTKSLRPRGEHAVGEGNGNPAAAAARPTETERVYQALKRAILAGELAPGVALQEVRLAAELGASRTPIREAFRRLEGDGLLVTSPRRGAFVRQPTVADFLDINELRAILEPIAARNAADLLAAETIAELAATLAAIPAADPDERAFADLEELDRRLHEAIAAAIPNRRMGRILEGLNDMMQIVREQDMRRRHRELHASIAQILAALGARDAAAAEALMRRHVSDFSGALRQLV